MKKLHIEDYIGYLILNAKYSKTPCNKCINYKGTKKEPWLCSEYDIIPGDILQYKKKCPKYKK